jgi:LPXTG-motif cell wall-anchored protein
MPAELPKTGIFDVKILGAGAALTILGALILLVL